MIHETVKIAIKAAVVIAAGAVCSALFGAPLNPHAGYTLEQRARMQALIVSIQQEGMRQLARTANASSGIH